MANSTTKNLKEDVAPKEEKKLPLARLRKDCLKLFGVTYCTFDGATYGMKGNHTVKDVKSAIEKWQNGQVFPGKKTGGKK